MCHLDDGAGTRAAAQLLIGSRYKCRICIREQETVAQNLTRRRLLISFCLLSAETGITSAQSNAQTRRVGLLALADPSSGAPLVEAFRHDLQKLGWLEGHNVRIDARWAAGQFERLRELATDLVRLPVDVILSGSNIETGVARQVTRTVPIVMLIGADPIGAGFVSNLAKPDSNVTGVSFDPTPQLFGKHLELLKELQPSTVRVLVIRNPSLPGGAAYWGAATAAAAALGMKLTSVTVEDAADVKPALAAISRAVGDAVFVFGDPITFGASRLLAEASLKNRLPLVSTLREYTVAGGLASYGVSFPDLARRSAFYVDRILRGTRASELPIEQPSKFELVVNRRTASSLGISLPRALLLRTDQVID